MNRETVISEYINSVEKILVAFHFNIEPESEDIRKVTLKTKEFTNALRELYLSNDENKDDKYKVIFEVIEKAHWHIAKENFETNPLGTYWAVIIYNLEIAFSHISELHFKETDYYYPFQKDVENSNQFKQRSSRQDNINDVDLLRETGADYIEKYEIRLNEFKDKYETDEADFVLKYLNYFENTLYDIENSEASHDGHSITGFENFDAAYKLCNEIGWEKFIYSTNKKIKYLKQKISLPPQQTETKTDKLKAELGKYGFFELPMVKQLSEPNKQSLIELISTNGLPYSIAMFEFLGFLKHIEKEHFKLKYKMNKEVAKWFNSDKEGRSVKGNISSLSVKSTENKSKYTAHTHKENVKTDYQKLK